MFRITDSNYEKVYHLLTANNLKRGNRIPGDEWKDEGDEHRMILDGPIELHEPLHNLHRRFIRIDKSYCSIIEINSLEDDSCFTNLSPYFRSKMQGMGLEFCPTSRNLTGFILKNNDGKLKALAGIITPLERSARVIGIGTFGTEKLPLDSPADFRLENDRLVSYVNTLTNCVWDYAGVSEKLPDINLQFPPL
jgi:hypothetical protein